MTSTLTLSLCRYGTGGGEEVGGGVRAEGRGEGGGEGRREGWGRKEKGEGKSPSCTQEERKMSA